MGTMKAAHHTKYYSKICIQSYPCLIQGTAETPPADELPTSNDPWVV